MVSYADAGRWPWGSSTIELLNSDQYIRGSPLTNTGFTLHWEIASRKSHCTIIHVQYMRLCFLTHVHAVVLSRRLIAVLVYHQTGKPLIHPKGPLTLSHIAIINRAAGFSYYYYSLGLRRRSVPLAHFEPKGVFLQRHPKLFFPSSLSPRLLPHQ